MKDKNDNSTFPTINKGRSKAMSVSKGSVVSDKSTVILLDENGQRVVIPGTDNTVLNQKDIPTVYDEEGEPICGETLSTGKICRYSAGRGTKHPGYGQCNKHESDEYKNVVSEEPSKTDSKAVKEVTSMVKRDTTKTYINKISDIRLRKHMEDLEKNRDLIYTNDEELLLLKAMQSLRLENFDFNSIDEEEGRRIFNDILKLTTLRDKGLLVNHELKKATHELISKREVLDFIDQVKLILQHNLRNLHVCTKCRHEIRHNMRDVVLQELGAIKPLW